MADYVDYETLEECKNFYGTTVVSEISDLITKIDNTNKQKLLQGWRNETSTAFVEAYERKYQPQLRALAEEMDNLATAIQAYTTQHKEDDAANAARFSNL